MREQLRQRQLARRGKKGMAAVGKEKPSKRITSPRMMRRKRAVKRQGM
jgi:hypothetical protein